MGRIKTLFIDRAKGPFNLLFLLKISKIGQKSLDKIIKI